ncbi:Threonylcarbamoyladenosine tRNA methylthiotransferase MtaB [Propionispora sp. 2/2-37]|uniref:tRNA (N(6)-L-threonylcarbamoyladenosine(37)-C(2))- methylthiotransferase MtaB n=1 Tax=Propionispora sp. 2/2-37 TaxID=1677858 RepID=UPI0006BB6F26|nr:tRNA (N(6)-L-threonylcarbamoyladenosine(37)-C(2))-methylthiotransferase MtaB [Propionispora sp. 2/2-37]CUH94149.1 Threonylcarbamoyladenosine tRNA methylthiotransferase MtaB [Propionispora sp. 2/2-37]
MPYVAFTTLGCKVNQYETEVMEGLFQAAHYTIVDFQDFADVYVINTCSVTHLGEKKSRQLIRKAIKTNPEALIAVTGCYAQVSPEEVEAIEGVDVIIGTRERQRIVQLIEEAARNKSKINIVSDIMKPSVFEDIPLERLPVRTRAFLKIQDGCTNFCTYCIIPYARGPLKSRPLSSVRQEALKLIHAGFREIVLTGIHLGAYGRDSASHDVTLAAAVKAVLELEGLDRLRLGSLESLEVEDELIYLMKKNPKFCRHLHLPLQAGSDSVLRAMNRHYTTAEYQRLINNIRTAVPDIAVSTDIIVGFPGETNDMFKETLHFVEKMNFAKMHIFPYSRRKGTTAADYAGQVPDEVKKNRVQTMREVADKKSNEYIRSFIGKDMQVLFEEVHNDVVDGLTGNYIRVYTKNSGEIVRKLCQVRFEAIYNDGLWGTVID